MIKQQEPETKGQKQINNKDKKVRIRNEYFLGEFTLEDYLLKEANLLISKFR